MVKRIGKKIINWLDWNDTYITHLAFAKLCPPTILTPLSCRINLASPFSLIFIMSATSSSSASISYSVDIEAQHTPSATTASSSTPMPVLTHEVRTPAQITRPIDPTDDFFGYTLTSTRTHDSRHDTEVPPPYVEESNLPEYAPYAEPVTLAMYLFKFGFCKFISSLLQRFAILISHL